MSGGLSRSLWRPTTTGRAIDVILIRSNARHLPLADESIQCCVTSPPYWGLRSYEGNPNMIGLEPTFDEHLANLVERVPRGPAGAA